MRFITSIVGVVAALATRVLGYPNPGSCSGQCWSHDPSVIRRASDGVYFRFETGSKIGIWKATDLVGPWTYQGAVLPNGSKIDLAGNDDLWVRSMGHLLSYMHMKLTRGSNPRHRMSSKSVTLTSSTTPFPLSACATQPLGTPPRQPWNTGAGPTAEPRASPPAPARTTTLLTGT